MVCASPLFFLPGLVRVSSDLLGTAIETPPEGAGWFVPAPHPLRLAGYKTSLPHVDISRRFLANLNPGKPIYG